MWFKGLSFLSYTALLVTPTNAAARGRGGLVHNGRSQLSARQHNIPYLHGRQQPWKNETRPSVTSQEPESTVSEPVVIITSDPQVTPTEIPVETSSAVITEEPFSTTAPVSEAPLSTSSVSRAEESAPSGDVTPPKPSSSAADKPVVSDPVQEPAPVTSVVLSSSSQAAPSTTAIPATKPFPISSTQLSTSEPIIDTGAEPQPSTTAPAPTLPSALVPDSSSVPTSSSIPAPIKESSLLALEPTSAPLSSSSIEVPVEEPSSILASIKGSSLTVPKPTSTPLPSPSIVTPVEEPSSILAPIEESSLPVPEPTGAPLPSPSIAVPVEQSSSIPAPIKESSLPVAEPTSASLPSPSIAVPVEEPSSILAPIKESSLPVSESTGVPLPSLPIAVPVEEPSSTLAPIKESSLPVPELTSAPLPLPSITVPVEEPSSTLEPSSSAVRPSSTSAISAPEPTITPSVLPGPAQPKPSSQQQASSTAEQQPSATSAQQAPPAQEPEPLSSAFPATSAPVIISSSMLVDPVLEPTATIASLPVASILIPEPSITQVPSSNALPQPSEIIATGDGENQAPVFGSSAASLDVLSSSLTSERPVVTTTSGAGLLPLPSDILAVPSSILSGINSILSSVLDPSNILDPTTGPVPSASQTGIDVPETTAPTTVLASSNSIQLTSSISGAQPTPSTNSEELLPVTSSRFTVSISASLIPTSDSGSTLSSSSSALVVPSATGSLMSTGISLDQIIPTDITTSGSIPASESLTLPTGNPTLSAVTSNLISIQTGIPTPSVTGTRPLSDSSLLSTLVSSQVSQADSTALIEESNTKVPLTTSAPAVLSPLPSFEVINTAISSSANQTDVPSPTGIPASETRSIPTTANTGLPSTLRPAPKPTTGISRPTNATNISSSFVGSATLGQFPITTDTAQPLPTKITKEDTQAPIVPIPTSESITSMTTTGLDAVQSDTSSSSSGSVGPSDGPNQPSATSASDEAPVSTGLPAGNENLVPSPTIPAGADESNTALHPSSTTTAAAAASPPPPLSKSQTVGIAIGGTTCLLFALIAALFVARRYHTKAVDKRHSNGVAYLPAGNHDAEAGGDIPAMSGGASGYGALAHDAPGQGPYGAIPPPMRSNSPRHTMASAWPADSNEPISENPFSDPPPPPSHALHMQNISRHGATDSTVSAWPTGNEMHASTPFLSPIMMPKPSFGNLANHGRTDTTVSAWPAGNQNRSSQDLATSPVIIPLSTFGNVPKHEPNESTVSAWPHNPKTMPDTDNPFLDPVAPGLQSSSHVGGGSVNKEMEEYVSLAINPYAFNPQAVQYPPMSPYVTAFPAATASRNSDPFEHDLLLNVDMRSETPDSIQLVTAPPPTPRSPHAQGRYAPEPAASSNNNLQPIARVPVGGRYSPDDRSYTPDSLAPPRGFTPDGRYTPTPELSSGLSTLNNSPVIGPLQTATAIPMHKGWDDIRSDNQLAMPPPLNLAQPIKKKPIPLRRQPTLAGAGQILLQGPGLPLIVKRKEVGTGMHGQNDSTGSGFGLEVPSMYGSPGPTINDFGGDLDSQRKRSGELMFADPQLVGRQF